MNLNKAKNGIIEKPFVNTKELEIITLHKDNKILGWKVNHKKRGEVKTFNVKGLGILQAWNEVEKFTEDIRV